MSPVLILLIIAIICWFIAAIPLPWANPVNMTALGLFFYGLSLLVR